MIGRLGSLVSLRVRGAEDWWFDVRRGVRTNGDAVPHRAADTVGPTLDGHVYLPARARNVREALASLPIDAPAEYTFVDMGSGKGRVVLLAADVPFKKVVGVEYSAALHKQAEENVRKARRSAGGCEDVQLELANAATYAFPPGNMVIFLFNPFGAEVMRRMLQNLEASLRMEPRHVVVVLLWPELSEIVARVEGMKLFKKTRRFEIFDRRA